MVRDTLYYTLYRLSAPIAVAGGHGVWEQGGSHQAGLRPWITQGTPRAYGARSNNHSPRVIRP
jgi:hypothetical protein